MASKAADFCIKLSQDPHKMEQFKQDPDAVLAGEDLSEEDKQVLKSGDPDRIIEHLGDDAPPGCLVIA